MKLGSLPYLNVKPLVYSLEHGGLPHGWELVYAAPAELADMLARGEIAVAPVSSFACFENPQLGICPGICIAAYGPVKSVLMLSKKPLDTVGTVALDTSSLSGANMLKIILDEAYNLRPEFIRLPPGAVAGMLDEADAVLVIGDQAMLCPKDGLFVLDLAEEWGKLTGLPAVFAVWAGPGITPEVIDILHDAKREGISALEQIAREESARLGLAFETCHNYLSQVMIYDLGDREMLGLKLFRDKSIEHGLVKSTSADIEVAAR